MRIPALRSSRLVGGEVSNVLGVDDSAARKLLRSGTLPEPTPASTLAPLRGWPMLTVSEGALTVLRTDARKASVDRHPQDVRRWIGFHVEHTDTELAESSLRWWRSNPETTVDNQLFAVVVAEFPVALYLIDKHFNSMIREDEIRPRHQFEGRLLARITPGLSVRYTEGLPDWLVVPCRQVMTSRIQLVSGGPIGYLRRRVPAPAAGM